MYMLSMTYNIWKRPHLKYHVLPVCVIFMMIAVKVRESESENRTVPSENHTLTRPTCWAQLTVYNTFNVSLSGIVFRYSISMPLMHVIGQQVHPMS